MMRNDPSVPFGNEEILLPKWLPDTPKPPPGVLVFFGEDDPEDYETTSLHLAKKGFVVALIRPNPSGDVESMKTQYEFLKNQYRAIPFFAASVGDQIPVAAEYAARHPKDFFGMIWIDPTFESRDIYMESRERPVSLFERVLHVFDDGPDVKDSVRTLPRIPLAVFTDDLRRSSELLSDISHDREITLLVFPRGDDPAYRMKALVRQLLAWHHDRVDELVQTKRGALRWDREQREQE